MSNGLSSRRPIRSRSSAWAKALVQVLIKTSITPNQISLASIVFAALGGLALVWSPTSAFMLLCALCIQLRLLCNLMDGMVAVEGGKASSTGVIYNEIPDRISDSLLLIAMGYAANLPSLGWLCALLAALTAYIRVFGGSLGLAQNFGGLLPKQRRMALLTLALSVNALEYAWNGSYFALQATAILMALGTAITCISRTKNIYKDLEKLNPKISKTIE